MCVPVYPGPSFGYHALGWHDLAPNATCRAALDARRLAMAAQEGVDQVRLELAAREALELVEDGLSRQPLRYGRWLFMLSKASQTVMMRAASGICPAESPSG